MTAAGSPTRRNQCRKVVGRLVLGFAIPLLLPNAVQAEGPGWTPNSIVRKLVVTGDGGINVLLDPMPRACVSNAGYGPNYASVYPSHPGINRIKAMLLLAYQTEKPVALYYDDNTCRVVEIQLGGW